MAADDIWGAHRDHGGLIERCTMEERQVSTSFVSRIWLEAGTDGDAIWRGHVRHVQSNEEAYFQDLGILNEFLARVSGVTGPALTAQPLKNATKSEPGPESGPESRSESGPESGPVATMTRKD